uniref:NADH-ubiquinone oxidoreductase chain 2 n=1 Tax=Lasioglossum sp. SJW-2017 TaxID=2008742 RepID=A0A343DRG6_9HYME|nr:NADH dehydrogenase subunit 2 [Lasioglossum sp. SJW-2017]
MKLFINSLLIIMTLMAIYTPNLFFMWMFLEISSMSFVIYLNINSIKTYSILYFLISSMSSIMIIFSILTQSYMLNFNYLLMFSIWLKLGLFPLNNWMNFMMKNINYYSLIPLITTMKIIPMLIFIFFIKFNFYIINMLIILTMPPIILSFNTSSYPMLLNYSSMYNMPLILMFSYFNLNMMMIYLIMYMMITIYISLMLNSCSVYYKNSLNLNMMNKNNFFFNLIMFSYAQLPPFSTFIMKWNLVNYIIKTNNNLILIMILMIFFSLLMTFNYLNFNNNNYLMNNMKIGHKINIKKKMKFKFILNISLINLMIMFIYIFME